MSDELLRVEGLTVEYRSRGRGRITALSDVSLSLCAGETLGVMGESGSGKSTLGRAILGLVQPTAGKIVFDGQDLAGLRKTQRRALAGDLRAVFQDPYNSFNPSVKVSKSLLEGIGNGTDGLARMESLLTEVGLPTSAADCYPSAFSGGQRQRLAIARSLMTSPRLVICDEAVSALDVSVQAQVLNLLRHFQQETHLAYLFIGHDIDVVRYMSDRIAVLYRGHVVEVGTADSVAHEPRHPYTQALVAAAPSRLPAAGEPRAAGQKVGEETATVPVPHQLAPEDGCPFATRCPLADERCWTDRPVLEEMPDAGFVACHRYSPAGEREGLQPQHVTH